MLNLIASPLTAVPAKEAFTHELQRFVTSAALDFFRQSL